MTTLDLCGDFISSGGILDLKLGSHPDDWKVKLGDSSSEYRPSATVLRLEFGSISAHFFLDQDKWECASISFDLHKLDKPWGALPNPVSERYGMPEKHVRFEDLISTPSQSSSPIYRILDGQMPEIDGFWFSDAKLSVQVVADSEFAAEENKSVGDVWSISRTANSSVENLRVEQYR
ncbi:hypothetical protein [Crossiella cryophila]|uniref:Uncharacterized protein n=1 Tax=Crossiella cryophila TaxID=43355 RepID=A0A7W7FWT0_9PSEU|nr:hypothetical protein [Crossiella cryophila]MBB4681831.1 hypothetical protein [Crossiella cryophila]